MPGLTVIINTYDMAREAPRTVQSALPPLQQAVTGADYEIIVLDNGSPAPLSLEGVDTAGVSLRLLRVDPADSHPSPVFAINDCIARDAKGHYILVCIDGARMFSPYLIRRTLDVLSRAPDAFTYVASRHLGPDVQSRSSQKGYDQSVEDALLAQSGWTDDLDRLNEVSVWAGAHFRRNAFFQNESNAIGLARDRWLAAGGYNTGFARSGGGLCNLELFSRFVTRPDARNVLLLGEATFHQFHGGAATGKSGYFRDSQAEYKEATGTDYALPRYDFEVDTGLAYNRLETTRDWYSA